MINQVRGTAGGASTSSPDSSEGAAERVLADPGSVAPLSEDRIGPYRVYHAFGKWRVSLNEATKYLYSGARKSVCLSFARRMAETHDENGIYVVTKADQMRFRSTARLMTSHNWLRMATRFTFETGIPPSECRTTGDWPINIERCDQRDGPETWAVRQMGSCLSTTGEWEHEPIPSSRDDHWKRSHRFATKEDALRAILAVIE